MAKIITIANRKGGVGKTTSAVSIGALLQDKGYKVLFIDLDKQADTSKNLQADLRGNGSYEILANKEQAINVIQVIENEETKTIHNLIVANKQLDEIPIKLNSVANRDTILKKSLASVKDDFDYIVIDTPPNLDAITFNALACSDYVIITSLASVFSLDGARALLDTIKEFKEETNPNLIIGGILLTSYNKQIILANDIKDVLKDIANNYNTKVFNTCIRKCTALEESQALNLTISEYKKNSNGYKDYELLVNEILEDLNK